MTSITKLKKRLVSTIAALTLLCTVFAPAATLTFAPTFTFVPFEFNGFLNGNTNDPLLNPIEVTLTVSENAGKLYFLILNTSDQNDPNVGSTVPTITTIFIEDPNDLLGGGSAGLFDASGSIGTVDYNDSQTNGGDLPGGNNIGFDMDFKFVAKSPSPDKGIDPGEAASFEVGTASASDVMNALAANEIRVGIHIQQIGPTGESASFIHTPEPGSALLGVIGSTILLVKRRR